jgi:hypothetical protein
LHYPHHLIQKVRHINNSAAERPEVTIANEGISLHLHATTESHHWYEATLAFDKMHAVDES